MSRRKYWAFGAGKCPEEAVWKESVRTEAGVRQGLQAGDFLWDAIHRPAGECELASTSSLSRWHAITGDVQRYCALVSIKVHEYCMLHAS